MSRPHTGIATIAALLLTLAATLAATARVEASPPAEAFDAMCRDVAAVAGGEPNVTTGVVIVDLETGDRCAINADRTYRTASLYKTVVAAELWRQVDAGIVSLDQPLTVEPRHHIDDAPDFRPANPYTITVYEAAERMITFSDNGTAFALRELLGASTVDAATEWLDMPATSLSTTFVTSPNDQATLFAALAHGQVVDEASSQAIVDLLLRQHVVDMIPAGLPEDAEVPVAHKTGTLDTFLHDAGIVFAPGGDFVLVVMTENASFEGALRTIQSVAGAAYAPYAEPVVPVAATVATPLATPVATVQTTTLPAAVVSTEPAFRLSDGSDSPFSDALQEPVVLAGMLVLVAAVVMAPVLLFRRRPISHAPRGGTPESTRMARGEVALERLAEHFRSQGDLLATMRDQFEDEMEPLHELIVKQSQTMHAVLQNLEDRLRPLNEYADGEEANLTALEERIRSGGQDHVVRSFSHYLEEQRRRIEETRTQIDEQRMPFIEYGDAQCETVESALSRFDGDLEALEENLAEQRRVMVRMLDAMRSETFTAVKDFLDGRQSVLAELAAQGSTDPVEISRATQQLREGLQAVASRSDYVRALLEEAEASDRALAAIVPTPRAIRNEPPPPALDEDDSSEDTEDEESEVSA